MLRPRIAPGWRLTLDRPAVGIDATPLTTGHATRGIGRHLARTFDAALVVDPAWVTRDVGTLLAAGQPAPLPGPTWRTVRSPVRPQDLDPYVAAIADRLAVRRSPPRRWHHTDPLLPWSPLSAKRTVVSVYDAIPLQDHRVWRSIAAHRRVVYRRYISLARSSRGVIASLSSSAADIAATMGIPIDRIAVVPPYVRRLGCDAVASATNPPGDDARPFIFVGVLEPHKRPELAIAVIATLVRRGTDATLTFTDSRPARRRATLEVLASEWGVSDRIRFAEHPEDDELDRLYAAGTLLATSRVEGFGQPPVEAILSGGRVVAVPIAAYRETVGDLATFARSDTAEALADAAEAAVDPPAMAARVGLADRFGAVASTAALRAAYERFG